MRPGTILVIGYGNDLRGDDAAGQRAAARVDAWRLPGVEVRALPQLTPELAEPLAAADRAVFLDARPASSGTDIRVHRLRAATPTARPAHTSDPAGLLALAQTAFGRSPEAWWITIPATDFSFGAPLSALAERGMTDALATVWRLLVPSDAAPAGLGCAATEAACPGAGTLVSDALRGHRRIVGCPTR